MAGTRGIEGPQRLDRPVGLGEAQMPGPAHGGAVAFAVGVERGVDVAVRALALDGEPALLGEPQQLHSAARAWDHRDMAFERDVLNNAEKIGATATDESGRYSLSAIPRADQLRREGGRSPDAALASVAEKARSGTSNVNDGLQS